MLKLEVGRPKKEKWKMENGKTEVQFDKIIPKRKNRSLRRFKIQDSRFKIQILNLES